VERIKQMLKTLLPEPMVRVIRNYLVQKKFKQFLNLPTEEVFSKVYETGVWGKSIDPSQPFFSGAGSRDSAVLSAYVAAVQDFLKTFDKRPNVVDLGCGDFFVGSKIRPFCAKYTACDIVPKLIEFNKRNFKNLDVEFRILDLVTDELPDGDIVIIRQVLQHLSNEQILLALPKISSKYRYLILTEHLPTKRNFQHNLDMPAGPGIRARMESGIVLTSQPFNLKAKGKLRLCESDEEGETGGLIVTTLYALA